MMQEHRNEKIAAIAVVCGLGAYALYAYAHSDGAVGNEKKYATECSARHTPTTVSAMKSESTSVGADTAEAQNSLFPKTSGGTKTEDSALFSPVMKFKPDPNSPLVRKTIESLKPQIELKKNFPEQLGSYIPIPGRCYEERKRPPIRTDCMLFNMPAAMEFELYSKEQTLA